MTHAFAFRLQPLVRVAAIIVISACLFAAADGVGAAENADDAKVKLLVLDLELIGDLGGPELERTHAERLRNVSQQLRSELAQSSGFEIIDATPAAEMIERLRGTQYLHKCNGCEIDIALELGADQVMVAWIHRVSQLILSLTYEIREVPSGRALRRKSFDFRGDNDTGWSRAVSYMVRDIAAAFPAGDIPSRGASRNALNFGDTPRSPGVSPPGMCGLRSMAGCDDLLVKEALHDTRAVLALPKGCPGLVDRAREPCHRSHSTHG